MRVGSGVLPLVDLAVSFGNLRMLGAFLWEGNEAVVFLWNQLKMEACPMRDFASGICEEKERWHGDFGGACWTHHGGCFVSGHVFRSGSFFRMHEWFFAFNYIRDPDVGWDQIKIFVWAAAGIIVGPGRLSNV